MKKLIASCLLATGILTTALLSGCTADNPVITEEDLSVKSHFYPIVNGSKYTYIRWNRTDGFDTVTYQVRLGEKRDDMNYLDRVNSDTTVPKVLYYFSYKNDQFGEQAAILKDSSEFFALAGKLQKDGWWIAQESPRMYARVFNVYDQYVTANDIPFNDVIAVKYWMDGKEETDYTLRYYAKNYGLINERKMIGGATEIGSLQLIGRSDNYSSWVKGNGLPNVDHKLGRYRSMMAREQKDEFIKY